MGKDRSQVILLQECLLCQMVKETLYTHRGVYILKKISIILFFCVSVFSECIFFCFFFPISQLSTINSRDCDWVSNQRINSVKSFSWVNK